MSDVSTPASFFRCPISGERAIGVLKVGRRRIPVTLVDASIEGYTLRVAKKYARKLRKDRKWILIAQHERTLVWPQWRFTAENGAATIAVCRLQDITPQEGVRRTWQLTGSIPKDSGSSLSGMALGGMLLLMIAIVCLPGIGDDLGTAPRIGSFLSDALRGFGISVRQFLNS
ncbi:hypothetical protein CA51_15250 [Rosistilla oblonga]|uniref:hypothetical protein n=1 Tax=Rosistilla oblonga TaxID=2527990 RepID=UPI0011899336|nr:hypothetical protein [Rosistilla oblonga]QDV11653.1 hypothetical protein CA51_15250 [Rosistilla oblonga]